MRVLRTHARCSSLEIGTAAKHTNVNVSYEKPYKGHKCIQNKINKGHKCIQNKINNDSKPCKGHRPQSSHYTNTQVLKGIDMRK